MRISFRWTPETSAWISGLSEIPDRVLSGMSTSLMAGAPALLRQMRDAMPVFEGDMRDELAWYGPFRSQQAVRLVFGWSGARTVMPEVESRDRGTAPFHYPWGKHDGIRPHRVLLYNVRTGRPRSKLIRWAQQAGIVPDTVPDDGTPSEIEAELGDAPALLFVAPGHTGFVFEALEGYADTLLSEMGRVLGVSWVA